MLGKILDFLGAKDYLSEETMKKGLEKINPKFKTIFNESTKYGYPLGATLGFLKSEFSGKQPPVDQTRRPDESANREIQRQQQGPQRIAGTLANIAGGAALGGLGGTAVSAIGSALSGGDQQQPQKQAQDQPREYDPLIGLQKFPELLKFVQAEHAAGGNAQSIGSKARKSSKLSGYIDNIEKETGENFETLLARLIGGQNASQTQEQPKQESQAKTQFLHGLDQLSQMLQGLKR